MSKAKIIKVVISRSVVCPDPNAKVTVTYSTGVCRTYSNYRCPVSVSRFATFERLIDRKMVEENNCSFIVQTYAEEPKQSEDVKPVAETVSADESEATTDTEKQDCEYCSDCLHYHQCYNKDIPENVSCLQYIKRRYYPRE